MKNKPSLLFLFAILALQALSVSVFAITAAPIVHNATQPNGFEFCLIVVGDEHVRSVYLADCNLSFDENLGGAEIYEGTDGYWRFKSNDTIIDNDGKAGIQNNGNKDYENQDLKTSIIIAVILIAAVLVAFKFRNKIFKKK